MLMVPQTHRSLGRPQVEQTSAILEARCSLVIVHDNSIARLAYLSVPSATMVYTPRYRKNRNQKSQAIPRARMTVVFSIMRFSDTSLVQG
jgi:hypothetical protein